MENNFKLSTEHERIIHAIIEEKTYKEMQDELNLKLGELQFRLRLLRKAFGVKTSVGLVVKYLKMTA